MDDVNSSHRRIPMADRKPYGHYCSVQVIIQTFQPRRVFLAAIKRKLRDNGLYMDYGASEKAVGGESTWLGEGSAPLMDCYGAQALRGA